MLCNSIVYLLVIVKGYYITVMLNEASIGVFEHNYMLVTILLHYIMKVNVY